MTKLHFGWSLLIALALPSPARADMGLPGTKPVKSVVQRITTDEDMPELAFLFVRIRGIYDNEKKEWLGGVRNEAELVELGIDKPASISGHRRERIEFLVVDRTAVGKKSSQEVLDDVVNQRIRVVFKKSFESPLSVSQWAEDDVVIEYRFQKASTGSGYELNGGWRGGSAWPCVGCLVCPAAAVLGGLWLIRRLKRRMPPPPTESRNP